MLRVLLALICLAGSLGAWTPEKWFDKAKSPRIANYRISAALDWQAKRLEGKETISWRNAGTAPTTEFPLHLYLNAFKGPQSRFMQESGGRLRSDLQIQPNQASGWGYCRVKEARMEGQTLQGHFGEDETVYWLRLPRAIAPGESIQVEISWTAQFPRVFARSGWGGHFLMAGQWFPKVGVYQGNRWVCHPYHAMTEFFSDFGVYDVELSLPNALLPAHTGTAVPQGAFDASPDPKRPGNFLWKLHAEDVHDFAWAVMPKRAWTLKVFEYRKVQVLYYLQPEHVDNLERQHAALKAALKHASDWYFPYPYPTLTVIDPPEEAKGADGMEYPTLITAGSVGFDPFNQRMAPEGVTVHEFGHQYFQGMLASNEIEEPWLDEGFTSWFTHKVMERSYQNLFASRRFQFGTDTGERLGYFMNPSLDPLTRAGHQVRKDASYWVIAYAKPTMVLNQLEALVGPPVMEQIVRAYAQEMAFKHPTRHDFRRIAERVSGRDLSAFWRDFVEGTEVLDYRIASVRNLETLKGGWTDTAQGPIFATPVAVAPGRRGRLTLERHGGLRLPITLWVRLEDRTEQRLTWDGQDRWITYDFDSPVVAAVLDPDGNHPMLKDRLHASWTSRPLRRGLHYWSQMLWGSFVGLLQTVGLG